MQTQNGRFILFDVATFGPWLAQLHVSRVITLVQNHHTWMPSYAHFNGNNHFEKLQGMEAAHLERGFSEIAQNLTTFPDGTVAVCRSFDNIPAGIKGANTTGICIEHLGNFDVGGDAMAPAHRDCIVAVNALLCQRFNLVPNSANIVYHHWYDLNTGVRTNGSGVTKSCPGTNFFGGNTVNDAETNFIPLVLQAQGDHAAVVPVPNGVPLYSASVTADVLNVRSQPSLSGTPVKTLRQGTLVNVFAEDSGWCRIDPAAEQWVSGRFLARSTT